LGFQRTQAARFSFLLAIPTIAGALVLNTAKLSALSMPALDLLLLGCTLAFVSSWIAMALMMKLLQRIGFMPFCLYRIGLGLLLVL
ncbi:MAG: undecaprenyl-diphosphate phosphatase, partial [Pseudomonadota bacterium]